MRDASKRHWLVPPFHSVELRSFSSTRGSALPRPSHSAARYSDRPLWLVQRFALTVYGTYLWPTLFSSTYINSGCFCLLVHRLTFPTHDRDEHALDIITTSNYLTHLLALSFQSTFPPASIPILAPALPAHIPTPRHHEFLERSPECLGRFHLSRLLFRSGVSTLRQRMACAPSRSHPRRCLKFVISLSLAQLEGSYLSLPFLLAIPTLGGWITLQSQVSPRPPLYYIRRCSFLSVRVAISVRPTHPCLWQSLSQHRLRPGSNGAPPSSSSRPPPLLSDTTSLRLSPYYSVSAGNVHAVLPSIFRHALAAPPDTPRAVIFAGLPCLVLLLLWVPDRQSDGGCQLCLPHGG